MKVKEVDVKDLQIGDRYMRNGVRWTIIALERESLNWVDVTIQSGPATGNDIRYDRWHVNNYLDVLCDE